VVERSIVSKSHKKPESALRVPVFYWFDGILKRPGMGVEIRRFLIAAGYRLNFSE
jgi:hypothetical protein